MSSDTDNGCGLGCLSWLGIGLGLMIWGPIGAIVAYAITSIINSSTSPTSRSKIRKGIGSTGPQRDFNISLLILSAAVMKADNTMLRSELDYIKRFYIKNFGEKRAGDYIKMLREILTKEYDLDKVTAQIRYIDYASRLQLLYYLFGIAEADNDINNYEIDVLYRISQGLNISNTDFESTKAMFGNTYNYNRQQGSSESHDYNKLDNAYKILEITSEASDDDVMKAYRNMAKKHHPDLVSHLGDDVRKSAEQKLQEINSAYELIKETRGIV